MTEKGDLSSNLRAWVANGLFHCRDGAGTYTRAATSDEKLLAAEIERSNRALWDAAELLWRNASREDVMHWAQGIKVSLRGMPGEPGSVDMREVETERRHDPEALRAALSEIMGLCGPQINQSTHWEGCADVHPFCRIFCVAQGAISHNGIAQEKSAPPVPCRGCGEHHGPPECGQKA